MTDCISELTASVMNRVRFKGDVPWAPSLDDVISRSPTPNYELEDAIELSVYLDPMAYLRRYFREANCWDPETRRQTREDLKKVFPIRLQELELPAIIEETPDSAYYSIVALAPTPSPGGTVKEGRP